MNYKMIVARFEEDVSWVKKYKSIIYNKGKTEISGSIKLQNVGREAHTYLRHIITNYHNLEDILIFTQANPFDHGGLNVDKLFDIGTRGYSDTAQDISNERWGKIESNHDGFFLKGKSSPPRFWSGDIANPKEYTLKEWWEQTTGEQYVRSDKVFWSAIFSVKKELILRRSLESYMDIYRTLLYDTTPVEAHYCERTWFNIFNIINKSN